MNIRIIDRKYIGKSHFAKLYEITVLVDGSYGKYTIQVIDGNPNKGD